MGYWDILGIESTTDIKQIKKAYVAKLKIYHPEEDEEGFKRLREAYEKALNTAKLIKKTSKESNLKTENEKEDFVNNKINDNKQDESSDLKNEIKVLNNFKENYLNNENQNNKGNIKINDFREELRLFNKLKHNELDEEDGGSNKNVLLDRNSISIQEQFVNIVSQIYSDFFSRINVNKWKDLLSREEFFKLDIKEKLSYDMLNFLRDHRNLPQNVYKLLNEKFSWSEQEKNLKKEFSKEFINEIMDEIHCDIGLGYEFFKKDFVFNFDKFIRLRREGYDALGKGDFEEAYDVLQTAYKLFPGDPSLIRMLGIYYIKTNDFEKALEAFNNLLNINPKNIDGYLNRAKILKKLNMFKKACTDYNQALKLDEDNIEALDGLADCYFNLGYFIEAKTLYEQISEQCPYDIDVNIRIIEINDKLISKYKEKMLQQPDDDFIKFDLAKCYFEVNLFDECISSAKSINSEFNSLDEVYLIIGKALMKQEKDNEAVDFFSKALSVAYEEGNDTYDILLERGKAYKNLKKYQEAIYDLEKVLKYNDSNETVLHMLAEAYRCRKKYDESICLINKAIQINPDKWQYYSARGLAYYRKNMYREALDDHSTVVKNRTSFSEAWYRKGYCHLQLEEYKDALNCFKKALDLGEKVYKDENLRMALAYFKLGDFNSALTEIKAYNSGNLKNCFGYILEGDIQRALDNFNEAKMAYSKAYCIKPESKYLTKLLVKQCLLNSEYEKAYDYIKNSLNINKNDEWELVSIILVNIQLKNWSRAEEYIKQYNEFLKTAKEVKFKAQVWFYSGIIKYQYSSYKEAAELFEKADMAGMKNSDLWSYMSIVYCYLKDMKKAEIYGKKALDLEPDNVDYENRYKSVLQYKEKNWFLNVFSKKPSFKELYPFIIPIKDYELDEFPLLNISIGENNEKNL